MRKPIYINKILLCVKDTRKQATLTPSTSPCHVLCVIDFHIFKTAFRERKEFHRIAAERAVNCERFIVFMVRHVDGEAQSCPSIPPPLLSPQLTGGQRVVFHSQATPGLEPATFSSLWCQLTAAVKVCLVLDCSSSQGALLLFTTCPSQRISELMSNGAYVLKKIGMGLSKSPKTKYCRHCRVFLPDKASVCTLLMLRRSSCSHLLQ